MVNILLAEDENSLNVLITTYLKSEGFNVFSCPDGEVALKSFEAFFHKLLQQQLLFDKLCI